MLHAGFGSPQERDGWGSKVAASPNSMSKSATVPPDPQADELCLRAFGSLQVAEFGRAESAARRALRRQERNAHGHALLAVALRGQGRFGEAEEHARKALEIEPGRPAFQFVLGLCLWSGGDPAEARRLFEEAIRQCPERSDMIMDFAGFMLHQRQFEEALDLARRAQELAPDHPKLRLLVLCAAEGVWRPEVDALAFRPPIPLPEDRVETYLRLGTDHMNANYFDLALDEFSRALDRDPASTQAQSLYATAFVMRRNGFFAWAHGFRLGASRPLSLLMWLVPLLGMAGGAWFVHQRGMTTPAMALGAAAALYLLGSLYVFVAGGRRLSPADFQTIVSSRNLTPQGRRKAAEKQVDEVEDLAGRRGRRRSAADTAVQVAPRQSGTGEDVTRIRGQLENRSRSLWNYSTAFFGLASVTGIVLIGAVLLKNTPGQLVTADILLAEKVAGAFTLFFGGVAIWFRMKAREMTARI